MATLAADPGPGGRDFPLMRSPAAFVGLLLLLLTSILSVQLYRQYRDDSETGRATARSLAAMLEENASRSFAAVDIFLSHSADTLSGLAGSAPAFSLSALRERMNARMNELPQVRAFLVLDENGNSIVDSASLAPRPFNGADRAYFTVHVRQPHAGLFVGEPVQSRINGLWAISVSRRINKADGSFGGVVLAAVDPAYFAAFYRTAQVTPRTALVLFHASGTRLARIPDTVVGTGSSAAGEPLFTRHLPAAPHGEFRMDDSADREPRYYAYRRVDGFPLVVGAGVAVADTHAAWRENLAFTAIALIVAIAAGLQFLVVLGRQQRQRRAAEQRLRDAIEALAEGFVLYDRTGLMVMANRRYYEITRQDPALVKPGTHYREIMRITAERRRDFAPDFDVTAYLDSITREFAAPSGLPVDGEPFPGVWLRMQRMRTAEGGVMTVFNDISDLKQAEQRLRDAIESLADGFLLYGPDNKIQIANRRFYELTGHDPAAVKPGSSHAEVLAIMRERRRAAWPDSDADGYAEALLDEHANPTGRPVDSEFLPGRWLRSVRHRTANGSTILVVSNITDLKRAEQRLREAIEALSEGFALYDAEGYLVMLNRRFYEVTGHDPARVKPGMHNSEVLAIAAERVHEAAPGLDVAAYRRALEEDFRNPTGRPIDAEVNPGRWLRTERQRTADGGIIAIIDDITDLKQAEQRLRDAIEALAEGFALYDRAGYLVMVNRRFYDLTGHDPAIVKVGVHNADVLRQAAAMAGKTAPGLEIDAYLETLQRDFENPTGKPIDAEVFPGRWLRTERQRTADGGIISIIGDISDLKRAENQLSDAIESMSDGFVLYDREERLVLCNGPYRKMNSVVADLLMPGARFSDLMRAAAERGLFDLSGAELEAWLAERLVKFRAGSGSSESRTTDGRWIRNTEHRTSDGGVVGIRTDITALKLQQEAMQRSISSLEAANRQVEEQSFHLRELADRLATEKERAEEGSRAKSEFLAMMSHEIRTPMNGVLGTIGLLQTTELTRHQAKLLGTSRESAEHLLTLINDILDFSKLEAGRIDLETIDFDLPHLVESTISMMTPRAVIKGLRLSSCLAPEAPRYLKGDPGRLRQILFNLVGNAIKFTAEGEIEIIVSSVRQADGHYDLTVKVRDTGIGIAADKIGALFGRFTQADSSIARRFGGTGLGLAISRQLVELMGGRIGIDSQVGRGSTFWFTLPIQEGQAVEEAATKIDGEGPAMQRSLRILVAEDNQINQMVIAMMLRQLGHQVDLAINGLEACEQVQKAPYDLVLMDMQMPEMDGIAATQAIRRLPDAVAGIPIIALTANAMDGDREKFLAAGMDDYVAKPIALPLLIAAINRTLGGAATADMPAPAPPPPPNATDGLSDRAKAGLGDLLASLKKLN